MNKYFGKMGKHEEIKATAMALRRIAIRNSVAFLGWRLGMNETDNNPTQTMD